MERALAALAWVGAALFAASGAMLSWEVAARYLFTAPTIWAAELSQLCLIWGCLLAMPWCLAARRHIAVDALAGLLPARAQAVAEVGGRLVVAAFAGIVTWKGAEIFLDSFQRGRTTGSMLDLPAWLAELAIPVGFGLLCLEAVRGIAAGAGQRAGPQA